MKKGLLHAYQAAGRGFLAYRLEKLFTKIETPADIALHNDILADVLKMVEGDDLAFMQSLSEIILYKREKKCKRKYITFLETIAGLIMNIGSKG